jgi:hypothetical protein
MGCFISKSSKQVKIDIDKEIEKGKEIEKVKEKGKVKDEEKIHINIKSPSNRDRDFSKKNSIVRVKAPEQISKKSDDSSLSSDSTHIQNQLSPYLPTKRRSFESDSIISILSDESDNVLENLESCSYLYCILYKEFLDPNECIYKIGISKQIIKKFDKYQCHFQNPKGDIIALFNLNNNKHVDFNKYMNDNFICMSDIGKNYYKGNINKILLMISNIFFNL